VACEHNVEIVMASPYFRRCKQISSPAVVGEDERRGSHPDAEDVGIGEDTARRGGPGYLYSGQREERDQRARNEIAQYRDAGIEELLGGFAPPGF
jgi:hypothetical protein